MKTNVNSTKEEVNKQVTEKVLGTMVGNIVFGDEGVYVVRPYSTEADRTAHITANPEQLEHDKAEALKFALEKVAVRIEHCEIELNRNFATATIVTPDGIAWNGGLFNLPTYKLMNDLIERNPTNWLELSKAELTQIIRAIHLQRNKSTLHYYDMRIQELAFNIATELLCCHE